jgi:hypothetical protein
MRVLACFECTKCKKPFVGGRVDCRAAAEEGDQALSDPAALVCPECQFQKMDRRCRKHGYKYAVYKVGGCLFANEMIHVYFFSLLLSSSVPFSSSSPFFLAQCDSCCAVATFECSSNHYCDRCHRDPGKKKHYPCPGPGKCPLGRWHPPNGAGVIGRGPDGETGSFDPGYVIGCTKCFAAAEGAVAGRHQSSNWSGRF